MKTSLASVILALAFSSAGRCDAFVVGPPSVVIGKTTTTTTTSVFSSRPDASSLVEEALKITAAHGIDSKQAQVAWDAVEEVDASDNSEATKASLDVDCEVEEEPSAACVDYGNFLDQLYILRDALDSSGSKSSKMKLGDVVKNIKLSPPSDGKAAPSSPKLTAALAEAKKATSEHGITSPEARLAWESYEEIASSGLDNAIGINLAEECDIESGLEACRAMEELQNILPVLQAVASE